MPPLLGPDDPPPFELVNPAGQAPIVLVCDHASRAVPRSLDQLGLPPDAFDKHIALDLGAGDLTRVLARRLGAPAVLCGYSRLLIECNRYLADPESFRDFSDGYPVPANRGLSQEDRDARVREVRSPYHGAIDRALDARRRDGFVPGLVSVHSFTPRLDGFERPWQIGVLWDKDPRFAVPLLEFFNSIPGIVVGDNEPYSGRHPADYTIDHHGERLGLPCVSLEIRQDLLCEEAGIAEWADLVVEGLAPLLEKPELFVVREDLAKG